VLPSLLQWSASLPYTTLFRPHPARRSLPRAYRHLGRRVVHLSRLHSLRAGRQGTASRGRRAAEGGASQVPGPAVAMGGLLPVLRSEEHTSDSSHVKISYAVFC